MLAGTARISDNGGMFDFASAWEVFVLFLIPIGGGIPAGVVLGASRGLDWPLMAVLYFCSDVVLAICFEPLLHFFLKASRTSPHLGRIRETLAQATRLTTSRYGINPGPFSLIMVTFGTDPMTGRAVAHAAGHGFFSGWALAIAGDMIFFGIIMASTLWLNAVLGDGTWAALIIMVAMLGIPALFTRVRRRLRGETDPNAARKLARGDYRSMPWKNGGGVTNEIARFPHGREGEKYDWRLSTAIVAKNGPFSLFPGLERLLVVWRGEGLLLNGNRLEPMEILRFAGDTPVDAELIAGPVEDLGLIYDPTRVETEMRGLGGDARLRFLPLLRAGEHFLFCVYGPLTVDGVRIGPGETWARTGRSPTRIRGPGQGLLVSIYPRAAPTA